MTRPAPEGERVTPLRRGHKSGHVITYPNEVCWCGDAHVYADEPLATQDATP